jgi:hypothetical protein
MKCSETELTNALAQIYYAVDNNNVSNNQDVIPKCEVTKPPDKVDDTIVPKRITGTNNNVPLENNRSKSSKKGSKQESVHLESDATPHKRKRITYEDDHPSCNSAQRCALCKGYNHDERTCENIRYPDNDEVIFTVFTIFCYFLLFVM